MGNTVELDTSEAGFRNEFRSQRPKAIVRTSESDFRLLRKGDALHTGDMKANTQRRESQSLKDGRREGWAEQG